MRAAEKLPSSAIEASRSSSRGASERSELVPWSEMVGLGIVSRPASLVPRPLVQSPRSMRFSAHESAASLLVARRVARLPSWLSREKARRGSGCAAVGDGAGQRGHARRLVDVSSSTCRTIGCEGLTPGCPWQRGQSGRSGRVCTPYGSLCITMLRTSLARWSRPWLAAMVRRITTRNSRRSRIRCVDDKFLSLGASARAVVTARRWRVGWRRRRSIWQRETDGVVLVVLHQRRKPRGRRREDLHKR